MKIFNSIISLMTTDSLGNNLGNKSLGSVVYTRDVQFISTKLFNRSFNEHYETNPFFCELAKTNDIKSWQKEGVPPVICIKVINDSNFHLILSYGCTRLNSAFSVAEEENRDIYVPTFIAPQEWVHVDVSNPNQRPKITLTSLFDSTAWTDQEYVSPIIGSFNDDDFCGFS